jgi:hypothetical protein
MTPDDLARIIFEDNAWLRAPSAAIERSTPINNAIRTHTKRCEKESRKNLFGRVQLHGAAHESVLATALLPGAFEGTLRPKGYVYYLAPIGLKKWKNPFEGIDLSFLNHLLPSLERLNPRQLPHLLRLLLHESHSVSRQLRVRLRSQRPMETTRVMLMPTLPDLVLHHAHTRQVVVRPLLYPDFER